MKLSRAEFECRYAAGTLRVALIGMSNIGKSYSGLRLAADYDFNLIEVDAMIWEELGEASMADFAAWQGQPYSEGYAEREAQSIAMETRATARAMSVDVRNPLLDTTGSVIYTAPSVIEGLRRDWYVVYIEAVDDHLERLKTQYFAQPKPLAWSGHYKKRDGMSERESLMASYPELLKSRANAYAAMSDHRVGSDQILTDDCASLFALIKPAGQQALAR